MNRSRLHLLFNNYIDRFDEIGFGEHDETYKWEIVQAFQDEFDLDAEDFAGMLRGLCRKSVNLIDNNTQLPFSALADYASEDPETVRSLFAALYEDDAGDLAVRQQKIDEFIAGTEQLREKYRPDSWRYVNDQRSVMAYLFLHDPDNNYLYKSTQAHEFADCVEFYDDWGAGANFKLPVYYRLCDELVAEMKMHPELMAANEQRFKKTTRDLYPDTSLHILCFDMIYSSQVYNLYCGIEYNHPNSAEKRKYLESKEKAEHLYEAYELARADAALLEEVKAHLSSLLVPGTEIKHKTYGCGVIEQTDNGFLLISFDEKIGTKKFGMLSSLAGGFVSPLVPGADEYIKDHAAVMKAETTIPNKLKKAESDLQPFKDLL